MKISQNLTREFLARYMVLPYLQNCNYQSHFKIRKEFPDKYLAVQGQQ